MVRVCDVIMGGGKSQSAIAYMNEHPEEHFVYITPFVTETERIARDCPDLHFVLPSDKLPQFSFSKLEHTRWLLGCGANIATTHVAFRSYTPDMIDSIQKYGYTLIIDEAVEVFTEAEYSDGDIKLMLDGGYIELVDGQYVYTGREYTGARLRDLFDMLKCNNLIQMQKGATGFQYYYWALPISILTSFKDIFVLTYMFESSELRYFFDIHKIQFEYIGVSREGGGHHFSERVSTQTQHLAHLKHMITVFDEDKLNAVGEHKNALSANWFKNHKEQTASLKSHLYNFIRNYNRKAKANDVMWSCFNKNISSLKGKGFSREHVQFNMKAKNDYRDKTVLAYCVNVFVSPQRIEFFRQYGIEYDVDGYALSTMIQWIWRSAIRDNMPITIYVPSRRMRTLLTEWLDSLESGGEAA